MSSIILILLLVAIVWFWLDSTKSKEIAIRAAAVACQDIGVQLLDQTVSLEKLKIRRNAKGHLTFLRIYRFDFSLQGNERLEGRAMMLGQTIKQIHLDRPDGTVIESVE